MASRSHPKLSIVIPSRRLDDASLQRLLASLKKQTFKDCEILIETKGNSEEAKAAAVLRAQGDIVGFFCTDNDIRDRDFLRTMVWYASQPGVTGAYTAQYDYVKEDHALNRYFALLGANDPLCWWLGKADRTTYHQPCSTRLVHFSTAIPSIGDNGFFTKRVLLLKANFTPETFGSCMCVCEDLRRLGHATYWVVEEQKLWHRTGNSWVDYLRRRWNYVRTLYWQKRSQRRWHMVSTLADWCGVVAFALCSFLVVPHCWVVIRGFRKVPDWAWVLHPLVCGLLTLLYTIAWLEALTRQWWSALCSGNKNLKTA